MAAGTQYFYKNWIFKPIIVERQYDLKVLNQARWQFFQFKMENNLNRKDTIPSLEDYRNVTREVFKVRPARKRKPTRRMIEEEKKKNVIYGKPKDK